MQSKQRRPVSQEEIQEHLESIHTYREGRMKRKYNNRSQTSNGSSGRRDEKYPLQRNKSNGSSRSRRSVFRDPFKEK